MDNRQALKVEFRVSIRTQVISGIPQGSILGSLLFLVFIADLRINIEPILYTKAIKGFRNLAEVEIFQHSPDMLHTWQEMNNMKFNFLKFQMLRFGTNKDPKDNSNLLANNMNNVIKVKYEVKDLCMIEYNGAYFTMPSNIAFAKNRRKAS